MGAPVARVVGKSGQLDRQHREHAGHQVEDQATEQGAEQGGDQRQRRGGRARRQVGLRGLGDKRQRRPVACDRKGGPQCLGSQGQHDGHGLRAVAALRRQGDGGGPGGAVPGLFPGCGSGDDFRGFGEEVKVLAAPGCGQSVDGKPDLFSVHSHLPRLRQREGHRQRLQGLVESRVANRAARR